VPIYAYRCGACGDFDAVFPMASAPARLDCRACGDTARRISGLLHRDRPPRNTDPQYSQWIAFSGTSVTLDGAQKYLDSHLAYQRACLHAIDYLTKFGYSPEQAYLLLGAASIEGRLSGVVDIPNSCATVYIPTAAFDFPIAPSSSGPVRIDPGQGAPKASF
jgi:formamidase